MMIRFLSILLLLSALLAQSTMAQQVTILASVDDSVIDADAFTSRYVDYLLRTGTQDEPRLRTAMLQQIINERLITADGHSRGVTDNEDFRHFRESMRQKLLVESLLEKRVRSHVEVTEADLEEAFLRINTEISARHLYARTRDAAERLRHRLDSGETFEVLAREVFVDTALANNGGSIGTFTFDELDPNFEDAAFGLARGEISAPVRTAQGYSVIQVTDRFTKPILTETEYAERKGKLAGFVLRKKRAQAQSDYVRSKADALNVTFGDGFPHLLAQITGLALVKDEKMDAFIAQPLVSFGDADERSTWTVGDFRARASYTDEAHRAQVRTEADLKEFITALAVREQMVSEAEALGLEETLDYRVAFESAVDEWVLERRRTELSRDVRIPEDSVRAHFDRFAGEFRTESGEPMPYDRARPLIIEQLRHDYTRDAAAAYVAGLRRAAAIETDRATLLALDIGGRSFSSNNSVPADVQ